MCVTWMVCSEPDNDVHDSRLWGGTCPAKGVKSRFEALQTEASNQSRPAIEIVCTIIGFSITRAYVDCLEFTGSSHTLHCTYNPLNPGKLSWVLSNRTFNFFPLLVPPDAVFLRSQSVEVCICSAISV
jgi:hypothetical protein